MYLHSSTASDLRPSLLIVNFEIEMWIIFLPGSSSLITLNLALTIYNDWRFLLITNDRWHLTFFDIKTHNSCISKRCDLMPGCQKFSQNFHSKVLPKFLENIRCWFRNVKRFQILIWLFGGQILRAWAYFNIARLSTLKGRISDVCLDISSNSKN